MPDDTPTLTGHRAEESAIDQIVAHLEAREQAAAKATESGSRQGTGTNGRTAAAPAASARTETAASTTDEEEASSSATDDDADERDEDEADPEETGASDEDTAEGEDEGTDDAEQEDEEDEQDEDAGDAGEDEQEESDEPAGTSDLEAEARAALAKHGLNVKLEDLPREARALVKQKLDAMQAGFTRAMQEQRQYRAEERQFRAEQKYREEHPEFYIAEMLAKDPSLIEKVNVLHDKQEDPDKKKLFEIEVKTHREEALAAVAKQVDATDRILSRADEIETYTRTACTKLNLPFDAVVNAVTLALYAKREQRPDETPDLTPAELDAVISKQAKVLGRHTRAEKRTQRKEQIRGRAQDRKRSTPAVRGGSGVPAAPMGKGKPKNDEEFADYFASKI